MSNRSEYGATKSRRSSKTIRENMKKKLGYWVAVLLSLSGHVHNSKSNQS